MNSFDELIGRYVDEVADFLPASSAISFVLGVSIIAPVGADERFGILSSLHREYGDFWYFRDALFNLQIWEILILAITSLSGPILAKGLARIFQKIGQKNIKEDISRVFSKAVSVASHGEIDATFTNAAHEWRVSRENSAMRAFKAASFLLSMTLISLFSFSRTMIWSDFFSALILVVVGVYASWKFSVRFFAGCLPERILRDASLGLIEPRLFEDNP